MAASPQQFLHMRKHNNTKGRTFFMAGLLALAACAGSATLSGVWQPSGTPSAATATAGNATAAAATGAAPRGNVRKMEMPAALRGVPEHLIAHTGHTVSFNREHNNPYYVAWELTAAEAGGSVPRAKSFLPDPAASPPHRATTADYKGCGYDRGHMVPAADMKWSAKAMKECFYMSNICPQNHSLNAGSWQTLEEACRRWAKQEGAVYIVCGPVYKKGRKQKAIGREHRITVPDGFFKVVMSLRKGREKAIGFYYANRAGRQEMAQTAMSVDNVEKLAGMDFYVKVNDKLEQKIEASYSPKAWH